METFENKNALSEQEEKLLMRSFDGECGVFARLRVRNLLRKNSHAQEFLDGLAMMKPAVADAVEAADGDSKVDLWQQIERRIADEEHAALFLGKRSFVEQPRESLSKSWLLIATPLSAVALALFIYFDKGEPNKVTPSSLTASIQTAPLEIQPVSVVARTPEANPWEVEWMRSEGRVSMIQHRGARVPILWVNRSEALRRLQQQEVHRLKDGSELRILDSRVPNALTVANE